VGEAHNTLFLYRASRIPLKEALRQWLEALGEEEAKALAYGRDRCLVTVVKRSGDLDHPTQTPNPYELRAFTECSELRWLCVPSERGTGRAAVLSDKSLGMPPAWQQEPLPIAGTLHQEYLVWGEGTGRSTAPGWSEVGEARIGALLLPLADVARGKRVTLHTVEYLRVEPEHGNTHVYAERLVKLEPPDVQQR